MYEPIHTTAEKLRAGTTTSTELVEFHLERIRRHDSKLHAFVEVYEREAREAAQATDRAARSGNGKGPLHGIPIALKDLIELEGRTATGGSLMWRNRVCTVTATAAQRLLDAGMIVLGKTHMVELAFGAWGTNKTMGTPWNPVDMETQRVPGGSSSGSAVAVAADLAPAALGSDTGGSVRIPAALCGIVGLKTTVGRVSNYGTLRLSDTLDTLGPMTRDVEDAALLYDVMQGPDERDRTTLGHQRADVHASLKRGIKGMRLAVLREPELGQVDPEVAAAFGTALGELRRLGATVDTITLPIAYERMAVLVGKLIAYEGYALNRDWIDRDDIEFDTDVRDRIRSGKVFSDADYRALMDEREKIKRETNERLRGFDALLMPTTPLPAIPVNEVDQSVAPMSRLTRPINYLDMCALAVPCGFTRGGLPISLQIAGRAYAEARVLQIGWAYENATPWRERRPAIS